MRSFTFFFMAALQLLSAQEVWEDRSRILPEKLRGIPTAIIMSHSPSPNYAELNPDKNGPKYIWEHSTCVQTLQEELEVVEAGSFIWIKDAGWMANMQFTGNALNKRFGIAKGRMETAQTYCYEKNIRYGDQLYGGDALWYVLAKNPNGELFKGIAIIETEGELITKTVKQ